MASGPITSWQIDGGKLETVTDFSFLGSKTTADSDCSHKIKRRLLLGRKAITNLDSILKSRDITLPTKVFYSSYGFSNSHVWMWELDCKESWGPKNWCFWTVVLVKTLESLLDSKEIKLVNLKGNQPWILTGKTDAEAEAPIFWPSKEKSRLTWKDADSGKDWGQKEKSLTEVEIVMHVYVPRFFVSSQQRFGVTGINAPSACHSSQVLDRPCYSPQVSNGPCYSS